LSRSKFASGLVTHSNDDGGDLTLLGVRSDNTLYDTDFNSEDGTNTLDNNDGLPRSKFESGLVTRSDDDDGGVASDFYFKGVDDLIMVR
jgi:hypothetical protein